MPHVKSSPSAVTGCGVDDPGSDAHHVVRTQCRNRHRHHPVKKIFMTEGPMIPYAP